MRSIFLGYDGALEVSKRLLERNWRIFAMVRFEFNDDVLAEIAEQGHEGTLAPGRGDTVVVRCVLPAQNPITSWRRRSACSRPRRGSFLRS